MNISEKQVIEFNRMRSALIKISKMYQTPDQLRRSASKQFGLDYEEALEMTYENIQQDAKMAVKGIKVI